NSPSAQEATLSATSGATAADEPITPLPAAPAADLRRVALGERLFSDPRLSRDNTRKCTTCHDVATNGASQQIRDTAPDGSDLWLNTTTVFNVALNFRLGWEGKFRTLESQIDALMHNPRIMNFSSAEAAARLRLDPVMVSGFQAAYGHGPD